MVSFLHSFRSPKRDGTDATLVKPSNWNEEHSVTMTGPALLGKVSGTGEVEEIPLSANMTFQDGALATTLEVALASEGGAGLIGIEGGGTVQSWIDAAGDISVGPFCSIATQTIPSGANRIQTSGFANAGDGGAAAYMRTTASLAAGGLGIWWTTAEDGSKWIIAPDQWHFAQCFGALGGSAIDARPIINEAFQCPNVSCIHLGDSAGSDAHWFTGSITPASGKGLIGYSPERSWLNVNTAGATGVIQRIHFQNDVGGFARDFSLDVKRDGEGMGDTRRSSGVTISATGTSTGKGTRVERVNVYNATGYAHYDSAGSTAQLRDIMRNDCKAYNSKVCFETTGNSEVVTIDCYANTDSAAVWDGGSYLPCEAVWHEYGPIQRVERVRCRSYGAAGVGAHPITTGSDIQTVIYDDCDVEITNAVPAMNAVGQSGNVIRDLRIYGGRFVSANADALLCTNTRVIARGARLHGGKSAENGLGNGSGANISTGAEADLFNCDVTGQSLTSSGASALGAYTQDTGILRVHGGSYTAIGPVGLMTALGSSVSTIVTAVLTPAPAVVGTALPRYRQWKRGTVSSWSTYNPGTPYYKYILINLDTAVIDVANVDMNISVYKTDSNGTALSVDVNAAWYWQGATSFVILLPPGVDTTKYTVKYSLIEWAF